MILSKFGHTQKCFQSPSHQIIFINAGCLTVSILHYNNFCVSGNRMTKHYNNVCGYGSWRLKHYNNLVAAEWISTAIILDQNDQAFYSRRSAKINLENFCSECNFCSSYVFCYFCILIFNFIQFLFSFLEWPQRTGWGRLVHCSNATHWNFPELCWG